jgi:hypothetical protein
MCGGLLTGGGGQLKLMVLEMSHEYEYHFVTNFTL